MRVPGSASAADGAVQLTPLAERSGFIGDFQSKTFEKQGDRDAPNHPTAWLPTARVAAAWQAILTEKPFAQ